MSFVSSWIWHKGMTPYSIILKQVSSSYCTLLGAYIGEACMIDTDVIQNRRKWAIPSTSWRQTTTNHSMQRLGSSATNYRVSLKACSLTFYTFQSPILEFVEEWHKAQVKSRKTLVSYMSISFDFIHEQHGELFQICMVGRVNFRASWF